LTIAALLAVPSVFGAPREMNGADSDDDWICSDVVIKMSEFEEYIRGDAQIPTRDEIVFDQVARTRRQLEMAVRDRLPASLDWGTFNANQDRIAAQAALICGGTPHIAHLVAGTGIFATRDSTSARIHPKSINFDRNHRSLWYLYKEMRASTAPFLHVTTAASPLELALFCESSAGMQYDFDGERDDTKENIDEWNDQEEWVYMADQWVPVSVSALKQRDGIVKLRRMLNFSMLNLVASDPQAFANHALYERLVLCVLSSMERERLEIETYLPPFFEI